MSLIEQVRARIVEASAAGVAGAPDVDGETEPFDVHVVDIPAVDIPATDVLDRSDLERMRREWAEPPRHR